MKTAALPEGFPVGRWRASRHIAKAISARATGSPVNLPQNMVSPLGGVAPSRTHASTYQGDVSKIKARGKGTLSEIVSSKATEKNVTQDRSPSAHNGEILPPDEGASVNKGGNGTTREAQGESKAAEVWARELLKAALLMPAHGAMPLSVARGAVEKARSLASSERLGIGRRLSPARAAFQAHPEVAGHAFAPNAGPVPRGGPIRPASQNAMPAPSGGTPSASGAHMIARGGPATASPFKLPSGPRAWSPPQEAGSMTMTNIPKPR